MNTIKTPSTVECSDMILLVRIFMCDCYKFEYSYYTFLIEVNVIIPERYDLAILDKHFVQLIYHRQIITKNLREEHTQ